MTATRAQSHVVGVALLMGVTVLALAGLTASIGALVETNAATADATRVADELDGALDPMETTGRNSGRVHFTAGRLRTVEREVRVLDARATRIRIDAGGLVYESGDQQVTYVTDAVLRGAGENAWLYDAPPVTAEQDGDVVVLSVTRLNVSGVAVSGAGETAVTLRSNVSHERTRLGAGTHGIAIETTKPEPLLRWFRDRNATAGRWDFDGDGIESVVARFPGNRTGYLVVHDVRLEVGHE
ncbi:DUF7289 family protein [Halorientalis litorea]|uniref:DUF7289 family protein n=1 Tax=Halorientalis litorea TaxID=2931977 RepID=UPI001FF2D6B2|nr:type IV pilin [Halorientalis litorea]